MSTPEVSMIRRTTSSSGSPTVRAQHPQLGATAGRTARAPRASTPRRRASRARRRGRRSRRGRCRRRSRSAGRPGSRPPAAAPPARRAARRPSRRRSRGPIAQRGPVSRVSRAALAVTSLSRWRVATTSATSGSRISPDRPTISTGHVAGGEGVEHVGGVGVVAGEHADVGPLRPGLVGGARPRRPARRARRPGSSSTRVDDLALPGVGLGGQPDDLAGVLVVERLRRAGWRPRGCGGRSGG